MAYIRSFVIEEFLVIYQCYIYIVVVVLNVGVGAAFYGPYKSSSSISAAAALRRRSWDSCISPCRCPSAYLDVFCRCLFPRPSCAGAVEAGGILAAGEASGEGERRGRGRSVVVGVRIGNYAEGGVCCGGGVVIRGGVVAPLTSLSGESCIRWRRCWRNTSCRCCRSCRSIISGPIRALSSVLPWAFRFIVARLWV